MQRGGWTGAALFRLEAKATCRDCQHGWPREAPLNYYNDSDPFVCAWVRELVAAGHLPPGDVDSRSILDVKPEEVAHYTQRHWFCGVGG